MILINTRTAKDTTMPCLSNEDRLVAIGMIEGGLSVREAAWIMGHQLAAAAQGEWRNIPQQSIQRLIKSMHQHCQDCVNAQGGHTRY